MGVSHALRAPRTQLLNLMPGGTFFFFLVIVDSDHVLVRSVDCLNLGTRLALKQVSDALSTCGLAAQTRHILAGC